MTVESPNNTIEEEPKYISQVRAIEESRSDIRITRERLKTIVEIPLLSACQKLYDKNILTVASSANQKDLVTGAYIILDYDSLSTKNKEIAQKVGEQLDDYDGQKVVALNFSLNKETTVQEIKKKAENVANQFHEQPAVWIKTYTFEEMKKIYAIPTGSDEYIPDDFVRYGWYWDSGDKLFYFNEEQFIKAKKKSDESTD